MKIFIILVAAVVIIVVGPVFLNRLFDWFDEREERKREKEGRIM